MAFVIATSIGTNQSNSTGRPNQNHLHYAHIQGAWWIFFLASSDQLASLYSINNGVSWTTPTGSPISLISVTNGEGLNFGFSQSTIDGYDVIHMISGYIQSSHNTPQIYHSRMITGTTIIQTNSEAQTGTNGSNGWASGYFGHTTSGIVSAAIPVDSSSGWGSISGASQVAIANNPEMGSSWTAGFGTPTEIYSSGNECTSTVIMPSGSADVLLVASNGYANGQFTNLIWSLYNGSTWSSAANVFPSSLTQADDNAFGLCTRTTTDIHVVALSDNSSSYIHYRFDGTSWSAGDTVQSLSYGTLSGVFLTSDGTYVYAVVIDTSFNVQYNQWISGSGWQGWAVLESSRPYQPAFMTGTYSADLSTFMVCWTESNGSGNYNIVGSIFSGYSVSNKFSSDSSSAFDQYRLINLSINYESSSSLDQYILSPHFYFADHATASDSMSQITFTISTDNSTGLESQYTFNVAISPSSDSASGSESQLILVPFFMDVDAGSASESQLIELYLSDSFYERDTQSLLSHMIISTDQALELESYLTMNTGGSSGTVYDKNPTAGVESQLIFIRSSDLSHELDIQSMSSTALSPANIESSTAYDTPLVKRYSSESPIAIDIQTFKNSVILVESSLGANGQESQWLYNLIPSADRSFAIEAYILSNTFIDISPANVDSASGSESQLPIFLSSSSAFEQESNHKIILSYDNPKQQESPLRIIFDANPSLAKDLDFLSISIITSGGGVTDSGLASEAILPIHLSGESSLSLSTALPVILNVSQAYGMEAAYLSTSFISTSSGTVDSAFGNSANLVIIIGTDAGYDIDSSGKSQAVIPVPQPSITTLNDVLLSIQAYIQSTGLFGPENVEFVIDPDSIILWPNQGGPICLIEPSDMNTAGDDIGGGRFSKTWEWTIKIHCILENIYDVAFRDYNLSTSFNTQSGPYRLVSELQQLMEQAYLTNSVGQPTVYEFPYYETTEQPRRYKGSNNYIGFPIVFRVLFRQNLTLNLP